MRINLPVTQREFEFDEGETLVSTTDLDSYITYCNPAFVRVSGYTRDELLGKPHNLVRHPDMPGEAFRDMWATLKAGLPWSALVKNRRKDGDHYWVVANATPIVENGRAVGYMSVRTKPSRAQVQEAEALYARMRQEKASGRQTIRLDRGRVEQTGLAGSLQSALRFGVVAKPAIALLIMGVVPLLVSTTLPFSGVPLFAIEALLIGGLATALALWLRAMVAKPLSEVVVAANRIAAGDLTQVIRTDRRDEVGELMRSMNQLNVNLQAIVSDVRREVERIEVAAGEIASGNSDLSSRTESQASSLQQTAATVEQFAGTVKQNAESASAASQLASEATDVANRGGKAVAEVVSTMHGIQTASRRIADIIGTIDGIAFQTNILALNAAVEAARAGEQGRGFAVVASEVRSLAQRSAAAAREIKSLIGDSVAQVETGNALVTSAGATMEEIQNAVTRVRQLIETVTTASSEQASGIDQVNAGIANIESTTQQNAALVEQSAASSAVLKQQAEALQQAVKIFKLRDRREASTV